MTTIDASRMQKFAPYLTSGRYFIPGEEPQPTITSSTQKVSDMTRTLDEDRVKKLIITNEQHLE